MKTRGAFVALALLTAPMLVHASCDAVKSSIDAKLKAKGLEGYTLTVAPHDEPVTDGKVVGQCEGDKQVVYTKGAPSDDQSAGGKTPAHHPHARTDRKPAVAEPASSGAPPQSDEPHPAMPSSSGG
ncbi:DUF1161 domain-containing protein [Rhodanobacter sp. Si-c]|uniref:DUF1161 domain-containing protein n=1 Tax=Rhodanobacter lycopersici TaxID=3162487 RepID=A0ABV3QIW9_9GAMM